MADHFPTALQRTSDERWVTLEVVSGDGSRAVAKVAEASDQTAVLRMGADQRYDDHLRRLIASPPPDAGRHVHLAWPVDLLHDLDGRVVGYTALRPSAARSYPLADFVDPVRRAEVAPMATRRHLLRVARNVATATAALHYAGHARIRGAQFRVDERAGVVVVRIDELSSGAADDIRVDDERRLGHLMVRLLSGHPWASAGALADLLATASTPGRGTTSAQQWFFALRDAERSLPRVVAAAPSPAAGSSDTDGRAGHSDAPDRHPDDPPGAGGGSVIDLTGAKDLATALRESSAPGARQPSPDGRAEARPIPVQSMAVAPEPARAVAPPAPARPFAVAEALPPSGPARSAFAVATGLTVGAVASVAPFVAFLAVASAMVLSSAIGVGRRKTTLGPHQFVAITASRLVPFATGGLALAAFVLLDLLLLLGLCMALAAQMFDYGPGFTLTWILQLPEVPGLVRAFSFAVGGLGGMSLGGQLYDRNRAGAGARRALVAPALALAASAGLLLADAGVVWWPLPPSA